MLENTLGDKLRTPQTYFYNQMAEIYGCINYCVKAGELPGGDGDRPRIFAAVMIHGESVAEEIGTSTRYAKVRASEKALEVIGGMLPTDFRLRFHCDCRPPSDELGVKTGDIGTAI
jgi:endoribonuclease Dicer